MNGQRGNAVGAQVGRDEHPLAGEPEHGVVEGMRRAEDHRLPSAGYRQRGQVHGFRDPGAQRGEPARVAGHDPVEQVRAAEHLCYVRGGRRVRDDPCLAEYRVPAAVVDVMVAVQHRLDAYPERGGRRRDLL